MLSRRDRSFNKAPKKAVSKFCKTHLHKKVEAFCEHCKQVLQKTIDKHDRDGIMRRNGLLLEHILLERIDKIDDAKSYFT